MNLSISGGGSFEVEHGPDAAEITNIQKTDFFQICRSACQTVGKKRTCPSFAVHRDLQIFRVNT